jgi:hypothetical protein
VLAQGRVRRDLEARLDGLVVDGLELEDLEARLVEEDLLRVLELGAREGEVDLGAALAPRGETRERFGDSRANAGSDTRSAATAKANPRFMQDLSVRDPCRIGCEAGQRTDVPGVSVSPA